MSYPKLVIITPCVVIALIIGVYVFGWYTFNNYPEPTKNPDAHPRRKDFASRLEYRKASLAWWEAKLENAKDPDEKKLSEEMVAMGKQDIARELRRIKRAEEDRIRAIRDEEMDTWLAEMNAYMRRETLKRQLQRWGLLDDKPKTTP